MVLEEKHIAIIAGNREQGMQYKKALGLDTARIIVTEYDFVGAHLDEIYYCGTYYNRSDWATIRNVLSMHKKLYCREFYHSEVSQ